MTTPRATARLSATTNNGDHHLRADNELAEIDRQMAALQERRDIIVAFQDAAQALLGIGYSHRQLRDMLPSNPTTATD